VISRTTKSFWQCFQDLPPAIRKQAKHAYELWHENPQHPSLQFKCINEKHQAYSVRIGIHWRALGYLEKQNNQKTLTWFWIGSHSDYDNLLKNQSR
jgi:hypothetical protein